MGPIAFLPGMLLAGVVSGATSGIVDLFTGASRKRKQAFDAQQAALDQEAAELQGDIGTSTLDSTSFKTAKSLLDTSYSDASKEADRMAAASGLGAEARIGQRAKLNDAYNKGALGALSNADAIRQQLKIRRRNVLMQKYGIQMNEANTNLGMQNQLAGGISSVLSQMLMSQVNPTSTSTKEGG